MKKSQKELLSIWSQVPPDYYQEGYRHNIFQRIWHKNKLDQVLSCIKQDLVGKILDVGCASGWFLSEISKKRSNLSCFGIDPYKKAIDFGSKKYKSLCLQNADAHNLPFPDNYFDLIICTEVLEHVENPITILSEIKRVLKKNGQAIIEMDTGNKLFQTVWKIWTKHFVGKVWKGAHLQHFTYIKLKNMIKKNGFVISEEKTFNLTMAVLFRCLPKK